MPNYCAIGTARNRTAPTWSLEPAQLGSISHCHINPSFFPLSLRSQKIFLSLPFPRDYLFFTILFTRANRNHCLIIHDRVPLRNKIYSNFILYFCICLFSKNSLISAFFWTINALAKIRSALSNILKHFRILAEFRLSL